MDLSPDTQRLLWKLAGVLVFLVAFGFILGVVNGRDSQGDQRDDEN